MTVGFVLVDKPAGPTSHDIVARVRRVLHLKRVGHAGTLDPAASGLLVIGVGPATRLLSYVQSLPKTYEVTGVLGVRTTTQDAAGEVVSHSDVQVRAADVRTAAAGLVGQIDQTPPAHSAVKVGGERAYRAARRGETLDLQPRRVTVYAFEVLRVSGDTFEARVECSTGTYVRTLVADVGESLGCGAHVRTLRRVVIGHLDVRDAVGPDDVDPSSVRAVEDVLTHLPRRDVDEADEARARTGRPLDADGDDQGDVLVCGPGGAVGVFRYDDGMLRPVTVLGR